MIVDGTQAGGGPGKDEIAAGRAELATARRKFRGYYWGTGILSAFVNLLMLTGPLYMLQVYDRVLASGLVPTLVGISLLAIYALVFMGILDFVRGRVMARVAGRFQDLIADRVFEAMMRRMATDASVKAQTAVEDLEAVRRLIAAPVLMVAYDIFWTPLFLFGIWLLHPVLFVLAVAGGAVLVALSILNRHFSKVRQSKAGNLSFQANRMAGEFGKEAEMVASMGMASAARERWSGSRREALLATASAEDVGGTFQASSKSLRMILQSAMLGLGAYLFLQQELSPGAIIAGTILFGRAIAPVDLAIGQWPTVQRAFRGWDSLAELLGTTPVESHRTDLPRPAARLEASDIRAIPPGESAATLEGVTFKVEPGQALAVIGPSGAGKSTLARIVTGAWKPARGTVRLGGAELRQYGPERLAELVGHLPQRVQMFEGTIAENIARMARNPDSDQVVAAAKKAGAHEMITALDKGYDTPVVAGGGRLSGGQMQRIGLARALYGDPVLLVLDEPGSSLDDVGLRALQGAIQAAKKEGRLVMVIAHRIPEVRQCDLCLVLRDGKLAAFGPTEEIIEKMTKNKGALRPVPKAG